MHWHLLLLVLCIPILSSHWWITPKIINNSATFIEIIFVNKPNLSSFLGFLSIDNSDHLLIKCIYIYIYIYQLRMSLSEWWWLFFRRNPLSNHKQDFGNTTTTLNWYEIYYERELQMAFSKFHFIYIYIYVYMTLIFQRRILNSDTILKLLLTNLAWNI